MHRPELVDLEWLTADSAPLLKEEERPWRDESLEEPDSQTEGRKDEHDHRQTDQDVKCPLDDAVGLVAVPIKAIIPYACFATRGVTFMSSITVPKLNGI